MATRARKAPARRRAKAEPYAALDALGIDGLCNRLQAGESITKVAKSLKTPKTTMLKWLAADEDRSARAREARSDAAAMYDEMAEEGIEKARTPFQLAKAKELAHHFRWRASKVNPRAYGEYVKQETPPVDGTTLLRELAARLPD